MFYVPLFQCDWNSNFENNALDDLLWTINFGTGANIDDHFKRLQELHPDIPLMCSEFWAGWFDHWGAKHETCLLYTSLNHWLLHNRKRDTGLVVCWILCRLRDVKRVGQLSLLMGIFGDVYKRQLLISNSRIH